MAKRTGEPFQGLKKRALQKTMNDYGGDATRIKDLARNTIIVPAEKVSAIAAELAQRVAK